MRRLILACLAMLGALFGASIALVPGEAHAQPMCLSTSSEPTRFRCYTVDRENALWRISFDGTTWGSWRTEEGAVAGQIHCISVLSRHDCFGRSADGTIVQRSMPFAGPSRWDNIGGSGSGTPNCHFTLRDFDCFVRAGDNTMWRRSGRLDAGWTDWHSAGGVLTGDPECVSQRDVRNGRIDCMVRNTSGGLSHVACVRGSPCAGWVNLDGVLNSRLSCVREVSAGRFHPFVCFVRGTDNRLHAKRYDGAWGPWQQVSDQVFSGDPSCVALSEGDLQCFAQVGGLRLHSIRRTAGTWGPWTELSDVPLLPAPRCTRMTGVTVCAGQDTLGRMVVHRIPDDGPAVAETVPGLLVHNLR